MLRHRSRESLTKDLPFFSSTMSSFFELPEDLSPELKVLVILREAFYLPLEDGTEHFCELPLKLFFSYRIIHRIIFISPIYSRFLLLFEKFAIRKDILLYKRRVCDKKEKFSEREKVYCDTCGPPYNFEITKT